MCTASVYKGRVAILAQALRTAHAHGVVLAGLADLAARPASSIPSGSARLLARAYLGQGLAVRRRDGADREQRRRGAGLTPGLFEALAEIYAGLAAVAVADAPEQSPTRHRSLIVLTSRSGEGL